MLDWWIYMIALLGGFFAGCINTLAGSGSAITLTILTELIGLPPNIANGSNRIGVFLQSSGSSFSFIKGEKLDIKRDRKIIVSTFIGSIIGFIIAVNISNDNFKSIFKYLMVLMLLIVLVKPKRWLKPTQTGAKQPWYILPLFLLVGIYGGFIQMGMGIFFLACMVLGAKYNLINGNAVKVTVTALYTVIGILIFASKGLIDWKMGGLLGIGQLAGGILMGHYAATVKGADKLAYYALILALLIALFLLFF